MNCIQIKITSVIFLSLMTGNVSGQVGTRFDNYEEINYVSSMKSNDFTYLIWDRNHHGDSIFSSETRPMFMYWDNDDNQLGYLIDTRNMTKLSASFYSANISNGLIVTGGSVGIGTSTPSETLEVDGNFGLKGSEGSLYQIRPSQNSTTGLAIRSVSNPTDGENIFTVESSGTSSRFGVTQTHGAWIKDGLRIGEQYNSAMPDLDGSLIVDGSVGIGTTTPTEKLEVNGTIRSKEVKVEAAPWPDYVFEPDYKLRSLEEIEKFIQSEKHLPEIPTAKEVEENGIELGKMNALLLKKIEELTLYTIEQEAEIQELQIAAKSQEQIAKNYKELLKRLEKLEKNTKDDE